MTWHDPEKMCPTWGCKIVLGMSQIMLHYVAEGTCYIIKTKLKSYKTILKKSIRIAQVKYYEAIFSKFKGDIGGTWKK